MGWGFHIQPYLVFNHKLLATKMIETEFPKQVRSQTDRLSENITIMLASKTRRLKEEHFGGFYLGVFETPPGEKIEK